MELLQLHYFRTVAKLEHMTKAAEQLRIAQPALSKTIARLEDDLGVPLFERSGRSIRLNAYGKAFLRRVETALDALEEGRREVNGMAGLEQGSIHLATSTLEILSEPLGAFVGAYPDVDFRLTQATPEEMTALLASGEADLLFTALPLAHPEFRSMPVLREEVFLAVPPGHRFAARGSIRLEEAQGEPFIAYKEGLLFQPMNDAFFREAGFKPRIVCRVDEPAAVSGLVLAGLGLALVGGCGKAPNARYPVVRIESPDCRRTHRLFWHDKRYLSGAARAFRSFLASHFGSRSEADGAATAGGDAASPDLREDVGVAG